MVKLTRFKQLFRADGAFGALGVTLSVLSLAACQQQPSPCDNADYATICTAAQGEESISLIVTYARLDAETKLEDVMFIKQRKRFLQGLPKDENVVLEHMFQQVPQAVVRVRSEYLTTFLRLDTLVSVALDEMAEPKRLLQVPNKRNEEGARR